jgi:hypothetical protein
MDGDVMAEWQTLVSPSARPRAPACLFSMPPPPQPVDASMEAAERCLHRSAVAKASVEPPWDGACVCSCEHRKRRMPDNPVPSIHFLHPNKKQTNRLLRPHPHRRGRGLGRGRPAARDEPGRRPGGPPAPGVPCPGAGGGRGGRGRGRVCAGTRVARWWCGGRWAVTASGIVAPKHSSRLGGRGAGGPGRGRRGWRGGRAACGGRGGGWKRRRQC